MKVAPLVLSFFLLFAFITNLPLAFSQAVMDPCGNHVVAGVEYKFPTIANGRVGGLLLQKTGQSTCHATLLYWYSRIPILNMDLILSSPGTGHGIINTSTPVDIEVPGKPDCVESGKWKVFIDNDIGQAYVGIGGPEDHPGKPLLSGSFRFQRVASPYYAIQFCDPSSTTCLDIVTHHITNFDVRMVITAPGDPLVITDQVMTAFMPAPSNNRSVV